MHRSFSLVPTVFGAAALVIAGSNVNLYAQRGGGAAGHGRPATAGTHAQGHVRPDNPGAQGHGRADNPGAQGHAHKPDTDAKEHGGTNPKGATGRPKVSDQLTHNNNLSLRVKGLFPDGTDLAKEAEDFRNLGQFVAAAHVAHNLDIPWADMKGKMTGDHPESLGKAIQDLRPQADAKTEASKAQKEADTDIKDSKDSSKTTTTTTSTTTKS